LGTANHANHANKPSAAFGRNQNLSSRQDAKGAKKTGAKTVPDLGDLGVFARDIILSLPMIYVSRPENFAQENKISTSSSAKPQAFNPNHQHVIASPARQSEPSTDYRLPTTVFFHHRERRVESRRTADSQAGYPMSMKRLGDALASSVFPAPPLKFRTAGFPQYGFKQEFDRDLR
jgi:hypothetical protein